MNRIALFDIGTNSIKFLIFEINKNGYEIIHEESIISRLGEGLNKYGCLSDVAINRNVHAISKLLMNKNYDVKEYFAFGTMALRAAKNSNDFIDAVKLETGISVEILSGMEEARLSSLAVAQDIENNNEKTLVFDTGGGSTEVMLLKKNKLVKYQSINVGAVQPTELFYKSDPISLADFTKMMNYIAKKLSSDLSFYKVNNVIGVGGSVTTLSAMVNKMQNYRPALINRTILTLKDIDSQIDNLSNKSLYERQKIPGLPAGRADVILAGALIIKAILDLSNLNKLQVSTKGLRHGLIIDRFMA